jgi:putative pyruvate formate lyase activating enzyme
MYPSYLNLSKKELKNRIEKLFKILKNCEICPRKCHVNRLKGEKGYCQLGHLPVVSAYHPHFGEETHLVGKYGSGTIFMTSCNLSCVFCQNYEISQLRIGKEVSFERLAEMMIELQSVGCHNINFVTPTPQVPAILKSLEIAIEKGLKIPLVYNTSSYDSLEVLKLLDGIFDIYLPDAKYSDDKIAQRYSNAPNYFEIMKSAIKEMHRQVGDLIISNLKSQNSKPKLKSQNFDNIPEGVALRGLIVRHLVLPNNLAGSEKIFEFIANEISKNTFLNIMDQYWPAYKAYQYPELSRRITKEEFAKVINLAKKFELKRLCD